MSKFKYLHIMVDNYRLNQEFYNFIKRNFKMSEHCFLIYKSKGIAIGTDELTYKKAGNVFWLEDSKIDAIKLIGASKRIFIHGWNSLLMPYILAIPGAVKKTIIIPWGGELAPSAAFPKGFRSKIGYCMKRIIFSNAAGFAFIDGDVGEKINELYRIQIKGSAVIHYYDEKEHDIVNKFFEAGQDKENDAVNILLCNNAQMTNMHIEALDKLKVYRNERMKIHIFLSTGGTDAYKAQVEEHAKELFGDNAVIYREIMPQEQYYSLLRKMDVAVYSGTRLQGTFTSYALIYAGCKFYCRKGNCTYEALTDLFRCTIYDYEDIGKKPYNEIVRYDASIRDYNRNRITETAFSTDYAVKSWEKLFAF